VVEAGNAGAARVRAAAGAQLVFDAHTGTVHESPVDPAVALAWRAGRLEFIGDRLDVVIASVNRYSTRPVVLADSRLGALAFTGTVFVESIDASLQALEQVFPVSVRHEPDVILITARPEPS
jgi:transmembrane sensor